MQLWSTKFSLLNYVLNARLTPMAPQSSYNVRSVKHVGLLILLVLLMALPGLAKLPVIDRDEARFAQASQQMVETGDYINIRFQDRARNKNPAGIYWLQSIALKTLSAPDKRQIWVQRLPSVIGAILAVLATYWGAVSMIGRRGAFMSAALLAVTLALVFEAHIAKTDALLCGLSAVALGAIHKMRSAKYYTIEQDKYNLSQAAEDDRNSARRASLVLWISIALSLLLKGPVLLALIALALISLAIWERNIAWMRALGFWLGPVLCLVLVTPWVVMIWQATDGQFFKDALLGDFGSKIAGSQEKHGGPPGYYAASLWIMFWPGCLFLLPGFVFIYRGLKQGLQDNSPTQKLIRLLCCWVVPFWLILEIVPTKLTHYSLPLFPALAIMCGAAAMTLLYVDGFKISRKISSLIFLAITTLICTILLIAQTLYGPEPRSLYLVAGLAGLLALTAGFSLWTGRAAPAFMAMLACAVVLSGASYRHVLPSLKTLLVTENLRDSFTRNNIKTPLTGGEKLYSPHYTEPSLIYHFGKSTRLGDQVDFTKLTLIPKSIVLLDRKADDARELMIKAVNAGTKAKLCWTEIDIVQGLNYSKGKEVEIAVLRADPCEPKPATPN